MSKFGSFPNRKFHTYHFARYLCKSKYISPLLLSSPLLVSLPLSLTSRKGYRGFRRLFAFRNEFRNEIVVFERREGAGTIAHSSSFRTQPQRVSQQSIYGNHQSQIRRKREEEVKRGREREVARDTVVGR